MDQKMDKCQVLHEAHELLSDPEHWWEGELTNGTNGIQSGTAWCALGAVSKVCGIDGYNYPDARQLPNSQYVNPTAAEVAHLLDATADEMFADAENMIEVNDNLGYEAVMRVFNKAINDNCP